MKTFEKFLRKGPIYTISKFLIYRNWEIINVCCFKQLLLSVIYYAQPWITNALVYIQLSYRDIRRYLEVFLVFITSEMLLESSGKRPKTLSNILQYTDSLPTTKSFLIQNINSAKVEKPWSKADYSTYRQQILDLVPHATSNTHCQKENHF